MFFKSLLVVATLSISVNLGASTYAYVDTMKAMETVKEGAAAKTKLEKELNEKKTTMAKREEELKKLTAEYKKKQLVMSNDKKEEEEQKLQKKYMEWQELGRQSEVQMQKRQADLMQPIVDNMRTIIAEVASKEKYDLVYDKNSGIFYANDAKDITDEVIKTYDEKIKTTEGKKGKK